MSKKIIGFDIGGTGVQYKVNEIEDEFSTKGLSKVEVINKLAEVINETQATHVGIASPGAVNTDTGVINGITGIVGWGGGFNLYDELNKKVNVESIKAVNDANAVLLGELVSESNLKNVVFITVGTGIGGAALVNGTIMNGTNGFGGEFGYSPLIGRNDKQISTAIASQSLIDEVIAKGFELDNAKDILESSDEDIKVIVEQWYRDLSMFLLGKFYDFDPELIIISGGVTNNTDFMGNITRHIDSISNEWGFTYRPTIRTATKKKPAILGAISLQG